MRRSRGRWVWLLVVVALLTNGCVSPTPAAGPGRTLGYTPRSVSGALLEEGLGEHPGNTERAMGGASDSAYGRQRVARARQAVLEAVAGVRSTTGRVTTSLSVLAARPPGLGNRGLSAGSGIFARYLDYGSRQRPWVDGALGSVTLLADVAGQVDDPDMELALLRMTGPRLQAAMSGAMLLAAWLDFLQLADTVLRECPAYSVERLFMDWTACSGCSSPPWRRSLPWIRRGSRQPPPRCPA